MAKPAAQRKPPGSDSFDAAHPRTEFEQEQARQLRQERIEEAERVGRAKKARQHSQPLPKGESPDSFDSFGNLLDEFHGISLRWNARLHRNEYHGREDETWKANTDSWRNGIRAMLARQWHFLKPGTKKGDKPKQMPWNVSREKAADWCDLLSQDNKADDVADYFDSLKDQWDRVPRIEFALNKYLGAEDTHLNRWASSFQFVGTVLATRFPGIHRRGIICLVGKQFSGKTTWILSLLPPHLRRYAAPVSLAGEDEQRSHRLVGMAIVELGELAGARRTDNDALKSWLTRPKDYLRLPWRRDPEEIERQCLLMASINDGQKLPEDASGSTRWVTVHCPKECNVEKIDDETRKQWWAEAVWLAETPQYAHQWEKGIPRELLDAQSEANAPHEARDETIENLLNAQDFEPGYTVKAVELAQEVGWLDRYYTDGTAVTRFPSKREQYEFTAELRKNGWVAHVWKKDGKPARGWKFCGK